MLFLLFLILMSTPVWALTPNPGHNYYEIATGVIQGNLLYGSANDTLSALPKSTTATHYLSNSGTNNNPAWAKVDLSSGISQILPLNHGGIPTTPTNSNQLVITNVALNGAWHNMPDCYGYKKGLIYDAGTQNFTCNRLSSYSLQIQALAHSPSRNQTVYFGGALATPNTSINLGGKIYITKPGVIVAVNVRAYSNTAGNNDAWSMYLRLNNTTDYLIQTVSASTNERTWINNNLNIPVVAGNFLNIKSVQPGWSILFGSPGSTVYGGYLIVSESP